MNGNSKKWMVMLKEKMNDNGKSKKWIVKVKKWMVKVQIEW